MFPSVVHFFAHHQFAIGMAAMWFLSALASSLPSPDAKDGKFYVTLYRMIQSAAASLKEIKNTQGLADALKTPDPNAAQK